MIPKLRIRSRFSLLVLLSMLMLVVFVNASSARPPDPIYHVTVKWVGYDFENPLTDNCGDGTDQDCEIRMNVFFTTSTSCSTGYGEWNGAVKTVHPETTYSSGHYSATWSRYYSLPCTSFNVEFQERDQTLWWYTYTDATALHPLTATTSLQTFEVPLTIGSETGNFIIEYRWYQTFA